MKLRDGVGTYRWKETYLTAMYRAYLDSNSSQQTKKKYEKIGNLNSACLMR